MAQVVYFSMLIDSPQPLAPVAMLGGALRGGQIGTSASLRHQTALTVYPSERKRYSILEGNGRHRSTHQEAS
jgi:hypothetical protein